MYSITLQCIIKNCLVH